MFLAYDGIIVSSFNRAMLQFKEFILMIWSPEFYTCDIPTFNFLHFHSGEKTEYGVLREINTLSEIAEWQTKK